MKKGPAAPSLCACVHSIPDYFSRFAFIVILAFSTLETGHPVLALSAAFLNAASSAFGTRALTSSWIAVIVQPASSLSMVNVALVLMLSGVRFAAPS